jgi:hypothetical protein
MSIATPEENARALRLEGKSIAKIMIATGLTERQVKAVIKDIPTILNTPLARAVARAFILAKRPYGIRDYELRDIMRDEYVATWDTTTGNYKSGYDSNDIKYVKQKVRLLAAQDDCNVLFVADWADEEAATDSRKFLEAAAIELMTRIEEILNEYMATFATRWREDSDEADLAQTKQRYAAELHLMKMAIKGYGKEPLPLLLARSLEMTDQIDGTSDIQITSATPKDDWYGERQEHYPEPSGYDPFLDYVEEQGWLKEVEHLFI